MLARVVAFDVEAMRIGEDLRVAVGPGQINDDPLTAPHREAGDVGVLARYPRGDLHR